MSDQHPPEAQRSVRSFLETVGAYVALLIPLVAPPLAYLGVRIGSSDLQWILSACVVFALSIGWLIGRLLKARRAIRDSAPVPKPRWLWQFLVGQLGSSPVELEHAPLLVLVPPGREEEASAIQAAYGSNERVDVISHYLPRSGSRHTDEDEGTTGPSGAERTLKQLSEVAERCAAVLLIDDGQWGTYPETLALINRWGTAHSTRPIITLNVEGLGTLRDYSWMPMTDAIGPTARLVSRILSQAVNRGVMWQEQAGALRTFAFAAVTFLFLVLSASVVLLGIQYQQRTALQTDVKQYQNALTPDAARQRDLALALHQYRNTDSTASSTEFRKLLDAYAEYLQQRMMVTDTAYRTASADVVMFSVSSTQDSTMIREITPGLFTPNRLAGP